MNDKFVITVCTAGKNKNLMNCLSNLLEIKEKSEYMVEIHLVINDFSTDLEINPKIKVIFEGLKGYSNVRNAAVKSLPENSNLIFLDDDEIPTLKWFQALVSKHMSYPEDIIFGPVYSIANESILSYRDDFKNFFDKLKDNSLVQQAGAGNMLIPKSLIKTGWVSFDPLFNLSGSEDTDFCFKMRRKGKQIRYAKEAAIYEVQDKNRFDSQFLHERFIRDTANYSLVIRRNSSLRFQIWRFSGLLLRILFFGLSSRVNKAFLPQYKAYSTSLRTFICGIPYAGEITNQSRS